jgi:hypothetical protein
MTPAWTNLLRRNLQASAAVAVFLVSAAVHAAVFRPALARYQRAASQAAELGMPLDLVTTEPVASARVAALLNENSLNAAVAEEQGTSGTLAADLLDQVTRLAARRGLDIVATEQGLVTQLPGSVQVRAHLKMRGRHAAFVDLLGDLARSGALIAVDRFTLQGEGASQTFEVSLRQLILKRTGTAR